MGIYGPGGEVEFGSRKTRVGPGRSVGETTESLRAKYMGMGWAMWRGGWILVVLAMLVVASRGEAAVTLSEVREIAREAYVYGFPLVDNYRVLYEMALDQEEPEFNVPASRQVKVGATGETYSVVPLDLRIEPVVLTLPAAGRGRHYAVKLVDLFTANFAGVGRRATGGDGGSLLIAGPNWRGTVPPAVAQVLRSETYLALVLYRTQLELPTDLEGLPQETPRAQVQPLSAFAGTAAPPQARQIEFIEPLAAAKERERLELFNQLAFVLQFCPLTPGDAELRERFQTIGLVPARPFGGAFLSEATKSALRAGMAEGEREIEARLAEFAWASEDASETAAERAAQSDAAFMIPFTFDGGGELLDGSVHRYTLTFAGGALPPATKWWSLAMYELPDQLPVENAIDRHDVNSKMLADMLPNEDGGLTIYIQKAPPGGNKEANWLPAPDGPFLMILRLVRPEESVRVNAWEAPAVERVD
jgi:hypothetical protein